MRAVIPANSTYAWLAILETATSFSLDIFKIQSDDQHQEYQRSTMQTELGGWPISS